VCSPGRRCTVSHRSHWARGSPYWAWLFGRGYALGREFEFWQFFEFVPNFYQM
jgi:hypothetical protein